MSKSEDKNKVVWPPPGHFYSPVIDIEEYLENIKYFSKDLNNIKGISSNVSEQLNLLSESFQILDLFPYSKDLPNTFSALPIYRYFPNNSMFNISDAFCLFFMLLKYKPKNAIEIGSGFSSAIFLDVNEHFFQRTMDLIFIEPYPERLKGLLKPKDEITLIESQVQKVPVSVFKKLKKGDVLFVDSSHVCKSGSDVNFIFFEILPILEEGVIIHFHDIGANFEYPENWIRNGRSWNESYLLRAFLSYNHKFSILLHLSNITVLHKEFLTNKIPFLLSIPGGSFWLSKN